MVVVDPGDPSDEAARAAIESVAALGGRIVAIAITSPDPDHAGGAEGLALRLHIPIFGDPGVGHDLPYEVRELSGRESAPGEDTELVAIATEALRLSRGATPPGSAGG